MIIKIKINIDLFTIKTIGKFRTNDVYLKENVNLTECDKINNNNKDNKNEFNLINTHINAGDYIKNSHKRYEFMPKDINNKFFQNKYSY